MTDAHARFQVTKRDLLKKSAYAVPGMLTLAAVPAFASAGSSDKRRRPLVTIRQRPLATATITRGSTPRLTRRTSR